MHLEKQQMMAEVPVFLPPIWVAWMDFLIPGFSLVHPWLVQPFREWTSKWKTVLPFLLSLILFLSNR